MNLKYRFIRRRRRPATWLIVAVTGPEVIYAVRAALPVAPEAQRLVITSLPTSHPALDPVVLRPDLVPIALRYMTRFRIPAGVNTTGWPAMAMAVPGTTAAWIERPAAPASPSAPPPAEGTAAHLAELGVAAIAHRPGADGSGVTLVDVESGWLLDHEDLTPHAPALIWGANRATNPGKDWYPALIDGRHGTHTLGVAIGAANGVGTVGVAPRPARVLLASSWPTGPEPPHAGHIADALMAAYDATSAGDVVVVEQQRQRLPVEIDLADLLALLTLSRGGRVVVEPAGNGSFDLATVHNPALAEFADGSTQALARHLDPTHPDCIDSGAVMVGATAGAWPTPAVHAASNRGGRIDSFARGDGVWAPGASPAEADASDAYYALYSHTSAAAAQLAGVAVALCGVARAAKADVDVAAVRRALRVAGTPVTDTDRVVPHLPGVLAKLGL